MQLCTLLRMFHVSMKECLDIHPHDLNPCCTFIIQRDDRLCLFGVTRLHRIFTGRKKGSELR